MPLSMVAMAGSLAVTVRELTVREVRDWATSVEKGLIKVDPIAFLALEDASLQDIEFMTDAKLAQLEALAPSEMAELVSTCKALNPHFFRLRSGMSGAAQVMQEQARQGKLSGPALP